MSLNSAHSSSCSNNFLACTPHTNSWHCLVSNIWEQSTPLYHFEPLPTAQHFVLPSLRQVILFLNLSFLLLLLFWICAGLVCFFFFRHDVFKVFHVPVCSLMFRIYGQRNRRGSLAGFQPLRNHPEVLIHRKQKETDTTASPTLTAHRAPSTEEKCLATPAHLTRERETWDSMTGCKPENSLLGFKISGDKAF